MRAIIDYEHWPENNRTGVSACVHRITETSVKNYNQAIEMARTYPVVLDGDFRKVDGITIFKRGRTTRILLTPETRWNPLKFQGEEILNKGETLTDYKHKLENDTTQNNSVGIIEMD